MLLPNIVEVFLIFCSIWLTNGFSYKYSSDTPELAYINESVDPCDNFYEYTCGNFKNIKPRPEKFPLWDQHLMLQEEIHSLMKVILESRGRVSDPVSLRKARTAYSACVNTEYADKLNVPEMAILKNTGNWPLISNSFYTNADFSWDVVGKLFAEYGIPFFFTIEVLPDLFYAPKNVIYIGRDRVLNPAIHPRLEQNSENFLEAKVLKSGAKHPFELFLAKIAFYLRRLSGSHKGNEAIMDEVSEILQFMRVVQQGGIKNESYYGTYNNKTVAELQNWADTEIGKEINLNWLEFLNRVFSKSGVEVFPETRVIIMDISIFYGVLNLIKQTEQAMLKNFVMTRLFTYTAPDSNNLIRDAYEQFRVDMGDMIFSRSEYCVRKVLDYPDSLGLGLALTYDYQLYHFNVNKLKAVADMITNLHSSFADILNDSEWLDDETRTIALEKANEMITLLGYPDFVENPELLDKYYENLRICSWDHFGNSQKLRAFRLASNLALLGYPRDREVWQLSPLAVNAYYNAQNNRILLPIAILNPVFYTGTISALDYGRLGATIGHEITHGFDSTGMYYDAEGSFTMGWWTESTSEEYELRKGCFTEQYARYYIPEIDAYVNPDNTLKENIADNGGLREAFRAFQKLLQRKSVLKSIEGYTPEQLFFIGFGTMWCSQESQEYLKNKMPTSSYPPARYRVIGAVSNNKEFSEAFNCPVGSNMNPESKCILW